MPVSHLKQHGPLKGRPVVLDTSRALCCTALRARCENALGLNKRHARAHAQQLLARAPVAAEQHRQRNAVLEAVPRPCSAVRAPQQPLGLRLRQRMLLRFSPTDT